jgi:hypothetical protein
VNRIAKQILISILFLGFGCLNFYFLKTLLFEEGEILVYFISFLLSLLFFAPCFVLLVLTFGKQKWQYLLYFLISLSIFLFFSFNVYTAVSAVALFLFFFAAARAVKEEKDSLLKFKFSRITRKGFGAFFTGLAILIAVLLFLSPKIIGGELTLPRSLFDAAWPMIENIFSQQMPGFSGEITVDGYIFLQVPDEQKAKITEEMLQEQREQFSEMVGYQLKGDEKLKDVFYEIFSSQISRVIEPYQQIGSWGLIFIFFLTIRMVLMFFSYICLPIAWLIFILFKKTKFFEIKTEKVDKEVLTI